MGLIQPTPPPYDPLEWSKLPFPARARQVCEAWALQGYGSPLAVYGVYALKIAAYVGAWVGFCSLSPSLGRAGEIASWWLRPLALQKAIIWSLLFEVLGFGCGSGPLTGRYFPPLGGLLYFLRPGTTKLPLFPGVPLLGGRRRSILDVGLYLALIAVALRALLAPALTMEHWLPIVILVPVLGILDRTLFLAARAEHYWTMSLCFAFTAGDGIAGGKAVQLALWFWAGFSKLNHHFPAVVGVMTSNGPFTPWQALRRRMYRAFPSDLRPSGMARVMGHAGTALELGVPILFLVTPLGHAPVVALFAMLALHGYITSNVPMGVPLEWNVVVVYGGFALFWAHPDVSILSVTPLPMQVFLVVMLVGLPLLGNLRPDWVSFLMAMRYYAGNWAYSVYLFRGEAYRKLDRLTATSAFVYDQLAHFYDRRTSVGLVGKVMAFRLMHLHGRALPLLLPKAINRLEDYEWLDGELIAGLALGWNFGEGHLHQEQLLESLQAQCGFEPGELRCIFVESQPLGGDALQYRICDAHAGRIDAGEVKIATLRAMQPWGESEPAAVAAATG